MATQFEVVSVLVALEFVFMAAIVLILVPLEAAVSIIPLLLVFLIALHLYRSSGRGTVSTNRVGETAI